LSLHRRSFGTGLLVFSLLCDLPSLAASSCPAVGQEIRLDQEPGNPFNPITEPRVPMFDQGEQGTCYAYTLTQLADYYRFKNTPPPRGSKTNAALLSSPGYLAYLARSQCNPDSDYSSLDGGTLNCTFSVLQNNQGVCSMEAVKKSLIREFIQPLGTRVDPNQHIPESLLFTQVENIFHARSNPVSAQEALASLDRIGSPNQCTQTSQPAPLTPESFYQTMALLQRYRDLDDQEFLYALNRALASACTPEQKLSPGKPLPLSFKRAGRAKNPSIPDQAIMRSVLEQGYPLGIGYCAGIFQYDRNTAMSKAFLIDSPQGRQAQKGCSGHASVIIGLRTNPKTGRCQALIRNTSGESCQGFARDWECTLGQIWMDTDLLSQNTTDLVGLLPPQP
jgi:hypothetical protein